MTDQPPPENASWLLNPVVWAAGLAGSMVSLAHTRGLTLGQRAMTVGVGLLTAVFLTPACAEFFKLSVNLAGAAGFLIGMAGMMLTAIIVNAAKAAQENPRLFFVYLRAVFLRAGGIPLPPPSVDIPAPAPLPPVPKEGAKP